MPFILNQNTGEILEASFKTIVECWNFETRHITLIEIETRSQVARMYRQTLILLYSATAISAYCDRVGTGTGGKS